METLEQLKYPVGRFEFDGYESEADRQLAIESFYMVPFILRGEVENLDNTQLDTPYREGGWTIRQVVHHLPDSHINCYIRFKLALTEDTPTIKPYNEKLWAELFDASKSNIDVSLDLLEAIHRKMDVLLRSMRSENFQREFFHPETNGTITLEKTLALYEWHGRHHIAHVTSLKQRMGW